MCRRCGEPDRRGSAQARRRRRTWLLAEYGNGAIAACTWCLELVGEQAGYLITPGGLAVPVRRLEQDRLEAGGPYARWNLVPACGPCNRSRSFERLDFPEGCAFGTAAAA